MSATPREPGGFTLLELMVVVAIIGILAVIAVPQFSKYLRAAKSAECEEKLDLIKKGSATYYAVPRTVYNTGKKLPCQFPKKVGTTPTGANCCAASNDADSDSRCDSRPGAWNDPSWSALKFAITDQHYFQYSYNSSGTLSSALYIAEANGDLDCDTKMSTFRLIGSGDPEATGADCNQVGAAAIFRDNETE
jgi:prepilin-type N-terminal cleavage/methylation domain-containing protein